MTNPWLAGLAPQLLLKRLRRVVAAPCWLLASALVPLLTSLPASAQDLSFSGFGTVGYAISNRPYSYQRSVNDRGTFDRDSLLGLQGDFRLNPQWSATVQLKAAQSLKQDGRWDLNAAWAFVAWRPADDWLLRLGRLRVPLYLHSEALDVGVAYDMAQLPYEMYSITPTTDFDGVAATKTWISGDREISLDGYIGGASSTVRFWTRDGVPGSVEPGARFVDARIRGQGLVLSLREPDRVWRIGLHRIRTRQIDAGAIPVRFPYVDIGNGLGYYKVAESLPGPPLPVTESVENYVFSVGVDETLAPGWRIAAEFARDIQRRTEVGSDTTGGYVALFRSMGRATPYLSWGRLRSGRKQTDWYNRLTQTQLPAFIPGAAQVNAAQRLQAEAIWAIDQRTLAFGSSYTIDEQQKLKLEWARTHIGRVSRLVDGPAGQATPRDTHIDVFSASYSFSF